MATVTIKIETDNAAFADGNETQEVARILRELATFMVAWNRVIDVYPNALRDINGNRVGEVTCADD